jgi:glycosyltransferase involved in cell wall biosynthesis
MTGEPGSQVTPRFSVVTPAYDAEATIGRAIASVVAQTLPDWELIVADDGSTDGTADLVESLSDPRVRLLRGVHGGLPAAARNRAIREARAEYVAFLDADDLWYPQKLERVAALLDRSPEADVVCHDMRVVAGGLPAGLRAYRSDGSGFYEQLAYRANFLSTSAVTVRLAALRAAGMFPEVPGEPIAEDYALWLRLAQMGSRFSLLPEVLGEYHRHRSNLTGDLGRAQQATLRVMDAAYRDLAGRGRLDVARAVRRRARTRAAFVRDAVRAGRCAMAMSMAVRLVAETSADRRAYRGLLRAEGVRSGARVIVFVNNFRGPGLGGGETQLVHLLRGCRAAGVDARLLHTGNAELEVSARAAGASTAILPLEPRNAPFAALALHRYLNGSGAALVQGTGFYTGLLCRLAALGFHGRVVSLVHVVPGAAAAAGESPAKLGLRRLLDRLGRTRVDAFVAVSDAVAHGLLQQGVPAGKVTVIHNGVDVQELRAAAAGAAGASLQQKAPLIGVVARLERVKGVEDFVRAAALLKHSHPEARSVVAGDGSLGAELRALARDLGLRHEISWLGNVAAVAPLLSSLTVAVLPSLSEGLPMVALEAMAMGAPVVATSVGGIPEIVEDGVTGILVPPGDPAALAEAVGTLLSDPERARALGLAGQARVEREFTVERMTDGYLALYERLLAERGTECPTCLAP